MFGKDAVLKSDAQGTPDYSEFLTNPDNQVCFAHVQQGDILYMPYKFWHEARTVESSISMNTFHISDEIVQRYLKNVLALPLALSLNRELLLEHDMRRYNLCMHRAGTMAKLLKLNPENILNINVRDEAEKKSA
jgi:ribosomal protein L16 Arg81 hydroxylase